MSDGWGQADHSPQRADHGRMASPNGRNYAGEDKREPYGQSRDDPPRPYRDGGGYGGGGSGRSGPPRGPSGPPPPSRPSDLPSNKDARVYVGNLAYEVGWQDLKDFAKQFKKKSFLITIYFVPSFSIFFFFFLSLSFLSFSLLTMRSLF